MAPCDPSDGSGSDRSCLDDGGVTRVSGVRRVPGPTTYHRTPVARMESSPSQQLRDTTRVFVLRELSAAVVYTTAGCVPRQRRALSGSRRKSAKHHCEEAIDSPLSGEPYASHSTTHDRRQLCDPFVPIAPRRQGSWRTRSAVSGDLHTMDRHAERTAHHTTVFRYCPPQMSP